MLKFLINFWTLLVEYNLTICTHPLIIWKRIIKGKNRNNIMSNFCNFHSLVSVVDDDEGCLQAETWGVGAADGSKKS